MPRFAKLTLEIVFFLLSYETITAQCPHVVIHASNGNCLGTTLSFSGVDSAIKIVWYKNDTAVKMVVRDGYATNGITVAGGNGTGDASNQLNAPQDVYVDANGNIFIADVTYGIYDSTGRVQKWEAGANTGTTVAGGNGSGSAANQLMYLLNIHVDAAGNIFIADASNNRVQKWTPGATSGITVAGGNGAGAAANQLYYPNALFVDSTGNMFISDGFNQRIQKWAPGAASGITVAGGNGAGTTANKLNYPAGVYVDASGNVFIADRANHRVQKWMPGAISGITVAGGQGAGAAANQLNGPTDVYVDATGNVFVADRNNHRVQKWPPGATSGTTVAGGNGAGAAANQLNYPSAVHIDAAGNIFIADQYNNRIQKWTEAPTSINTSYVPGSSGNYTAVATYPGGCIAASNAITVIDTLKPVISNFSPQKAGAGTLVTISGTNFSDATAVSFGGIAAASFTVVNDGTIKAVTGAGANGNVTVSALCGGTGSKAGFQYCSISSPVLGRGSTLCLGDTLFLSAADSATKIVWFRADTAVRTEFFQQYAGTTVAGGNGPGYAGNQIVPSDVYVDRYGNMYIADVHGNRIQKWAPGATSGITVAGGFGYGGAATQFKYPYGVSVDTTGNVFVADVDNHRVQKWVPGAASGVTVAGGNGPSFSNNQLTSPHGIHVDTAGNIFIADYGNHRIVKWAPGANSGTTVAGITGALGSAANQFYFPTDVFVDVLGNMFIADEQNHRVQKWAPGATSGITVAGGNGAGAAANQLNSPRSVFVDTMGNIFIADVQNHRVQKWTRGADSGTTVAGGNGYGSEHFQLSYPAGIYLNKAGHIFVSDAGNYRIQKWTEKIPPVDTTYKPVSAGSYTAVVTYAAGCTVTSNAVMVTFCTYWTGAVNSSWNEPGNWSTSMIPDANTAVFINSGTVVVDANAVCYSLFIASGIQITVNPGIHLTVLH